MKIAVLYYDDFAQFEVALSCFILSMEHTITSVALEQRLYKSLDGQRFAVDMTVDDADPEDFGMLVIPGGTPDSLYTSDTLRTFIAQVLSRGGKVAGICGGSALLAAYGFLDGKACTGETSGVTKDDPSFALYTQAQLSDQHVVVDGSIITAQGQAFMEFAIELGVQTGSIKNNESAAEWLKWLKNIR